MPLFLDRLPLYAWTPQALRSERRLLSVSLPVVLSDPGQLPPPTARPQRWALDTRFTGEAYAWRHHLQEAGLNPDRLRHGFTRLRPLGGLSQDFPVRSADLWLVSNIPVLRHTPWRLELNQGIACRDVPRLPDAETDCPLLGLRALEQSGLQVYIDFAHGTVSLWTPGSRYEALGLFLRRLPSRFATLPLHWDSLGC